MRNYRVWGSRLLWMGLLAASGCAEGVKDDETGHVAGSASVVAGNGAGVAAAGADACHSDPQKTAPGNCGCGVPESAGCAGMGAPAPTAGSQNTSGTGGVGAAGSGVAAGTGTTGGTGSSAGAGGTGATAGNAGNAGTGAADCGGDPSDEDMDGTLDCLDGCPADANKTDPGSCGCGTPETDTDGDGSPDCVDNCPDDMSKLEPGTCGCGTPDSDTDSDGALDCEEDCPEDPNRQLPGTCGCVGGTALAPAGDPCEDGLCPGSFTCDGAGACGDYTACQQPSDVSCGSPQPHNGHLYYLCSSNRDFDAARAACQSATGFDLVRIDDEMEENFVEGLTSGDAWIGARRTPADDTWRWVVTDEAFWDSAGAVGSAFTDWDSGDPNGTGDCVRLDEGDDAWRDNDCDDTMDFVCESVPNECPDDPSKRLPGFCGCGNPETDGDGDGVPDCVDLCPSDPNKTEPDACGCIGDSSPIAAGTTCADPDCPLNLSCDGAGTCGRVDACDPPDTGCGSLQLRDGHGYWFCTSNRSWDGARTACQSRGMDLARVDSGAENAWLSDRISNDAWLGASHSGAGAWQWTDGDQFWSGQSGGQMTCADGSPCDASSGGLYSNWNGGEPDASGTDSQCAQLNDGLLGSDWDDVSCSNTRDYVCETVAAP